MAATQSTSLIPSLGGYQPAPLRSTQAKGAPTFGLCSAPLGLCPFFLDEESGRSSGQTHPQFLPFPLDSRIPCPNSFKPTLGFLQGFVSGTALWRATVVLMTEDAQGVLCGLVAEVGPVHCASTCPVRPLADSRRKRHPDEPSLPSTF